MDWYGATLSEYYAEDFATFTEENFNAISSNDRRQLRELLRKLGVYVRKGRGVSIAGELVELIAK